MFVHVFSPIVETDAIRSIELYALFMKTVEATGAGVAAVSIFRDTLNHGSLCTGTLVFFIAAAWLPLHKGVE